MPALRTIARPPLKDSVVVRIPDEYRTCALEIIVLPAVPQTPGEYEYFDFGGVRRLDAADAKAFANKGLQEIAGTWVEDSDTDKVLDEMRMIDTEMWK